jgi:glycosyltransferase involved in cell wall biosynthesis
MPAHNAERFVAAAIDSVLRQGFQDWELVLVDDGSSDRTADIAESFLYDRIRVIRQAHSGPEAARQRAFAGCSTQFVARMDADDVMAHSRLRIQVEHLRACEAVGAVGGQIEFLSEDGCRSGFRSNWPLGHENIRRRFLALKGGVCNSAMMCRRELQTRVQAVRAGEPGADVDVVLRFATMSRLANVSEVVTYVRIHQQSLQSSYDPIKLLRRARFGLACVKSQQVGDTPPGWQEFVRSWSDRRVWQRLLDRRSILIGRMARRAQWHVLNRQKSARAYGFVALAGILAPGRALRRLGGSRVRRWLRQCGRVDACGRSSRS